MPCHAQRMSAVAALTGQAMDCGVYAQIVQGGEINVGDLVVRI